MGFGLPANDTPGKNRLISRRAQVATSGRKRSVSDMARSGNFSRPVVENARSGDKRIQIKNPVDL